MHHRPIFDDNTALRSLMQAHLGGRWRSACIEIERSNLGEPFIVHDLGDQHATHFFCASLSPKEATQLQQAIRRFDPRCMPSLQQQDATHCVVWLNIDKARTLAKNDAFLTTTLTQPLIDRLHHATPLHGEPAMITDDITDLSADLSRVSGHATWQWNPGQQAYTTAPLETSLARALAGDIEALSVHVSRLPQGNETVLALGDEAARDYLINAEHDRNTQGAVPGDAVLASLQAAYPQFVWQGQQGGYVATGFNPTQRDELVQPFLKAGVNPRDTDVESMEDGTTAGLFFSNNLVERLLDGRRLQR